MTRPLVVLDFDGTLARIARNPPDARISAPNRRELASVAERSRVIILTGRPSSFVKRQLGGVPARVIGLHGNARLKAGKEMRVLQVSLRKLLSKFSGVLFEKKPVGFTVHYRNAASGKRPAVEALIAGFARRSGKSCTVVRGRKCYEFLPPCAMTKKKVLASLVCSVPRRNVLFIGDDYSDYEAIVAAGAQKVFTGAMVESGETRFFGVKTIKRRVLFPFIRKWLQRHA